MTSSELKTVKQVIAKLTELAERLDESSIGVKRITKTEACVRVYGLKADLQTMLQRTSDLFAEA